MIIKILDSSPRIIVLLMSVSATFFLTDQASATQWEVQLPEINQNISPLHKNNRPLLFKRIVATFDSKYASINKQSLKTNLADGYTVYYLRQELQALIDMWRATDNIKYLDQAKTLTLKAINDARSNQRELIWHDQARGSWPCFFSDKIEKATGGHGQLFDFQGSAGFMMVANALKQADQTGWKEIADFVETKIIEKWLFFAPGRKAEAYYGPKSNMYLLVALNTGRDKREHFATICMDLDNFGYSKYPYKQWSISLTELYIGVRENLNQQPPNAKELGNVSPTDWGVIPNKSTGGLTWYWMLDWRKKENLSLQDTAHANRTVWLATKAYSEGLISQDRLNGFVNTLKHQVWSPDKEPFYFNNIIDGTDIEVQQLGPGRKGNIWFGWHRLSAYDPVLNELFISLAYDLTNGGHNFTRFSQNLKMRNAQICQLAWAARLTAESESKQLFP